MIKVTLVKRFERLLPADVATISGRAGPLAQPVLVEVVLPVMRRLIL